MSINSVKYKIKTNICINKNYYKLKMSLNDVEILKVEMNAKFSKFVNKIF